MLVSPMKRRSPSTETVGGATGAASLAGIVGSVVDGCRLGRAPFVDVMSLFSGASVPRTSNPGGDSEEGKAKRSALVIPGRGDDRSVVDASDGAWPPGPFACSAPWVWALPLPAP